MLEASTYPNAFKEHQHMNIYTCTICDRTFNTSHSLNSHKVFHKPGYAVKHKTRKINSEKTRQINKQRKEDSVKLYNLSPRTCKRCDIPLPYNKRHNKFCNRSCGASFNNVTRQMTQDTRNKISKTVSSKYFPRTRVYLCTCEICNIVYYYPKPGSSKRACSVECTRAIMSNNSRLHPKCGGQRTYKSHMYNGIHLDSTYELEVAKSLDANEVKWVRPKFVWYLDSNNKLRRYYPDFYLPDYDIYLDPKNDYLIKTDTFKIKQAELYNNIKIVILNKDQLSWEIIKMVAMGNSAIPTLGM